MTNLGPGDSNAAGFDVFRGTTFAFDLSAIGPAGETEEDNLSYLLSNDALTSPDADLFTIDGAGILAFKSAPEEASNGNPLDIAINIVGLNDATTTFFASIFVQDS